MILIITHRDDFTADYVIDKLNKSSIPYFRFNCEDYLDYNIVLQYGEQGGYSINGITDFTSVWYRRIRLPKLNVENENERLYLLGEIDACMQNLFGIVDAKWLSHPAEVAKAENKFLQLSLAKAIGFNVPHTVVTTDRQKLLSFARKNDRTIIKPIAKGRINYSDNTSKLIFTNIMNESIINQIETFELTPAIYQEYIEKAYEIRVTIVGNDVYAAKVDSQSDEAATVDWRRKKLKFEKYELPGVLRKNCLLLLKKLNISFGAIDLIKARNGKYYFLEVNPNGQWVWIEKDTGLRITESIIKYLT